MSSSTSTERILRALGGLGVCALLLLGSGREVSAGNVVLPQLPGGPRVRTQSLLEMRFGATVRQEHDFSCGAAAVATLLTHHYARATSESEVFRYMWQAGDQKRIRAVGFSLLDMKRFLNARGYAADGYRITLGQLTRVATPAIALVSTQGYRHFVVIQGVSADEVLISDPAAGARALPRRELEAIRDPVLLVIPPHATQSTSPLLASWRLRPQAPVERSVRGLREWGRDALLLPTIGEP